MNSLIIFLISSVLICLIIKRVVDACLKQRERYRKKVNERDRESKIKREKEKERERKREKEEETAIESTRTMCVWRGLLEKKRAGIMYMCVCVCVHVIVSFYV